MTPFDFLTMIWPDAGLYCLATPATNGYSHKVVGDIQDAADWVALNAPNKNIFFNVHVLREAKVWNPNKKNHDHTTGGWSIRVQANMRAAKAWFFDLDVGEGDGKFADQREAITDLKAFCQATGLPLPTMVSSGGGIHVYWIVDEEVPSSPDWGIRAQKLKQLAQHYNFKVDPARTTDTSSVLRVPGTFNLKGGNKRDVKVLARAPVMKLADFDAILNAAMVGCNLAPKQVAQQMAVPGLPSNTAREFEGRKLTLKEVVATCKQMERAVRLRGNVLEPEWYAHLGVVVECKNADTLIHKISEGHPTYNHAETIAKAERAKIGPTTCQKLHDVSGNRTLCHDCKFYDGGAFKAKGPLQATRVEEAPAPPPVIETLVDDTVVITEIPNPPKPYKRGKSGGIVKIEEDEEGKQYTKTIHSHDLYPLSRHRNTMLENEYQTWRYHPPQGGIHDFVISANEFVGKDLRGVLARHGVYAASNADFNGLNHYMSAYIQELVRTKGLGRQHNHLGWVDHHQHFVLGTKAIKRDGTSEPVTFGGIATEAPKIVCHAGSLADQVKLMRFFARKELVAQQVQILASLASVLLHMTSLHGLICHATGETGGLKSTTLLACAALWGPPIKYHMNGSAKGATTGMRFTRMDMLSNLPLCLDELTNVDPLEVRDFALGVSQAKGRERLDRFGNPKPTLDNEKSAITITNGNKSLYNVVMMDAEANAPAAMRIFEMEFTKQPAHIRENVPGLLHGLSANYGHIGEAFVRFVMKNYDKIAERRRIMDERMWPLWKNHGGERYWWMKKAVVLLAGSIAKDQGWLDFDLVEIDQYMTAQITKNRNVVMSDVERNDPVNVFADYLNHASGNTLVTNTDSKGDPFPIGNAPHGAVTLHFDTTKGVMIISREHLHGYCKHRGVPMRNMLADLYAKAIVLDPNSKRIIGQGTLFARSRVPCVVVDMKHAAVAGIAPQVSSTNAANVVPLKRPAGAAGP